MIGGDDLEIGAQGRYHRRPSSERVPKNQPSKLAFTAKVVVELDFDLANALGNFLLDKKCENPALQALAWHLVGSD